MGYVVGVRDILPEDCVPQTATLLGQIARSFYYFFMIVVVTTYKTEATARRALTFIVRISVNDTIAIAVWTCFHADRSS